MTYAYSLDATTIQSVGRLPRAARRLDDDAWVLGLPDATVAVQQACGWWAVTDVPRPADTATATFERTVEFVAGTVTVVWTERPKTQAELDAEALNVRQETRRLNVEQAVSTLRTWSDQAESTTVTQGNAVATVQTMVDRLGVFFDRFADLVEAQYGEQ